MAAPAGNQYAAKDKLWRAAILRALERRSRAEQVEELDKLADKFLDACHTGDLGAFKELGDRLDGKPKQQMDLGNADGKPFEVIQRTVVDPRHSDS